MPRRSDPRNPLVINSANEFTEVGYLAGGTPMPVNVLAGAFNPSDGTLSYIGTVKYLGTFGTVNYVQQMGTLWALAYGTVSYRPPSVLVCGTKLVAGTATPETLAASTPLWNSVMIQALYSNAGTVFLKCSNLLALSGIAMVARDVATIVIDDLAKVYVAVTTAGEGVSYVGS